jgi:hypothetical protein
MMVTYHMTHEQSAGWGLGGPAADRVAEAIAEAIEAIACPEDVLVEADDGSVAFVLERGCI